MAESAPQAREGDAEARPGETGGRWRRDRRADVRLAERAAAGDDSAFEALVRRHDAALRGYCVQLLRRLEDAEDALQDALAAAHRALVARGPPAEPRAWLFAIARNRCLSALRTRPPDPLALDEVPEQATACAAEVALSRAELRALFADLGELDTEAREALVLTRLGDFSHNEVAAIVGCAPERVRTLVRQARIDLAAARLARERPCYEIRAELAELRRGGFRRAHIRRHLAACEPCRSFRRRLAAQDRALGIALPIPGGAALEQALGRGAETAGEAAVAGGAAAAGGAPATGGLTLGGVKAAVATLAVGAGLVGGGAVITVDPASPRESEGDTAPAADPVPPRPVAGSRRMGGGPETRAARAAGEATRPGPGAIETGEAKGEEPPPPPPASAATAVETDPSGSRATFSDPPRPEPDRGRSRTAPEPEPDEPGSPPAPDGPGVPEPPAPETDDGDGRVSPGGDASEEEAGVG